MYTRNQLLSKVTQPNTCEILALLHSKACTITIHWEVGHCPPSNAKVTNAWRYTTFPPFVMAQCSIKCIFLLINQISFLIIIDKLHLHSLP